MKYRDLTAEELAELRAYEEELGAIRKGSFVKVCINEERFWVDVDAVQGNIIQGRVGNHLVNNPWPLGQRLVLEKRHVYAVTQRD